jgi:hypothetical protein
MLLRTTKQYLPGVSAVKAKLGNAKSDYISPSSFPHQSVMSSRHTAGEVVNNVRPHPAVKRLGRQSFAGAMRLTPRLLRRPPVA